MNPEEDILQTMLAQTAEASTTGQLTAPPVDPLILTHINPLASQVPVQLATTQVYSAPVVQPVPFVQPAKLPAVQKMSEWNPVGMPPKGYKPSDSCAKCQFFAHWDSGYCYKFDFPCAAAYVCSSFQQFSPTYVQPATVTKFAEPSAETLPAVDTSKAVTVNVVGFVPDAEKPTAKASIPQAEGSIPYSDLLVPASKVEPITEEDRAALIRYKGGQAIGAMSLSRLRDRGLIGREEPITSVITTEEPVYAQSQLTLAIPMLVSSFSDFHGLDLSEPSSSVIYDLAKGVVTRQLGHEPSSKEVFATYESFYARKYPTQGAYSLKQDVNADLLSTLITEAKEVYSDFPSATSDQWIKLHYRKELTSNV
jgi:hypothetical protein